MSLPADWRTSEFGSHWPVLLGLLEFLPIRDVLETGSGNYSTHLILGDPGVEQLVSVENDPKWVKARKDSRHSVIRAEGPIAMNLPPLLDFDLVFVDDDPVEQRGNTIATILNQSHPLVVVHDADFPDFFTLLQRHDARIHRRRKPWTGVVWPRR